MLVEVVAVRGVKVAVMQVVDVVAVTDGGMSATLAVDVGMVPVDLVLIQSLVPFARVPAMAGGASAGSSLAWASALKMRSTMC